MEFEKDGRVEFLYKKDTALDEYGQVSGILTVEFDGVIVY